VILHVTEYFAKSHDVIGNSTIRYTAYELLVAFHSNYSPILCHFQVTDAWTDSIVCATHSIAHLNFHKTSLTCTYYPVAGS